MSCTALALEKFQAFIDRLDPTGFTGDPEPLLGNDTSYALTAAIEYKF